MSLRRAILLALLAAVAGCTSAPSSQRLYALKPIAAQGAASPAAGPTIVVGPVTVPELVDRPQWVVQQGDHGVRILEGHRWAEPLRDALARTLATNLGRLLGSDRVITWRQAAASRAEARLTVDVSAWEARVGEQVTIEILWTFSQSGREGSLAHRSSVTEAAAGPTHDDLAAAFDRAVLRLAEDAARFVANATRRG